MGDDDFKMDLFWSSIERLGQRGCESAAKLAENVQNSTQQPNCDASLNAEVALHN